MNTRSLLFISLAFLFSCTANYRYLPASEQPDLSNIRYYNGSPFLQSQLNGASIAVELTSIGDRSLTLHLSVTNAGLEPFDFFPEQTRVTGYDASGKSMPFKVFSAEQVIRQEKHRDLAVAGIALLATATAIAVAVNANDSNPPDPNQQNVYDDQSEFWYTVATAPALLVEAVAVNSAVHKTELFTPADGLLRRHTLYPGETLQGVMKIKARSGFLEHIVVEVPAGTGSAPFRFEHREKRP